MFWEKFRNLDHKSHLLLGIVIRITFIAYGLYHDEHFHVPYTDVDYQVFTDAARHVIDYGSPYERHTYRYSPLLAYILIPNILYHKVFGKIVFSLFDLFVAVLIRSLIKNSLKEYEAYAKKNDKNHSNKSNLKYLRQRKRGRHERLDKNKSHEDLQADFGMFLWLYNPLTVAIATRGNADSLAGLLVLLTLYFLQCKRNIFAAGIIHGLAIHLRLYPIAYSLTLFMYLSKYSYYSSGCNQNKKANKSREQLLNKGSEVAVSDSLQEKRTIFKKQYLDYLVPNFNQLKLITGCLLTLITLTSTFYYLYGYKFLYESYLYHLIRKDTRHNFSLYFYLQYLTAGIKNIGLWQKVLIAMPQIVLLIVFSLRYGLNKFSLNFGLLVQTFTMVTYNTVLTSQYFIWILVVLPLCTWQIKMKLKTALFLIFIWFAAQAAWLMPAYFLEFQGQNTFLFIWLQSVSFFCANIAILGRLIMNYMPLRKNKSD